MGYAAALVRGGDRNGIHRSIPWVECPRHAARPLPSDLLRFGSDAVRRVHERTGLDLRTTLSRNWKLGSLLGLVLGVALVGNVFSEDATPRPDGAYFVFELIWRGGIYGAVDALC